MEKGKIIIAKKNDRVFFHVIGDHMEYYDVESLTRNHKELSEYLSRHGMELSRQLLMQREINNAHGQL